MVKTQNDKSKFGFLKTRPWRKPSRTSKPQRERETMAVSSFQCPTIFSSSSISGFQCRSDPDLVGSPVGGSSRRRVNVTAGIASSFAGDGGLSSRILRFPPNFVRQLSIKARRNCSNIGVAQIVAAKWSNNPSSGLPSAAAAAAASSASAVSSAASAAAASSAAAAPVAAVPPVVLKSVDEEVVVAEEGIREKIGSVQLTDSKHSFLSSDGSLTVHAGTSLSARSILQSFLVGFWAFRI